MKLIKFLVIKFLAMTNLILINSQNMDLNANKQPVQLCYTYSSMELKCLRDIVFHNSCYKTLLAQTCKRITDLKIYKKEEDVELESKVKNNKILDMLTCLI